MADIEKLGKYEIRRELGRGAMGIVYEGYDPLIKRSVALKTIRADQLAGENAETVIARFRREAQAAGRLSHPNIVSIYDFGEEEGVWYIAMEFVKGRELKDYFQGNERFTTADIVRIMTKILDALDYSHRQGVIHRDIKPANIILLPDGSVKVADFGIAHIETSNMTQVGTTLGTPAYMSPEQIMGLPVDGRSDLFSAGVILYQFLTGERPFSGTSTSTMRKVLEENPLPPSRFNVQAPPAMDAVVRKALAKRPEERFQCAGEFAAALNAAAHGEMAASAPRAVAAAADATVLATTSVPPSAANVASTQPSVTVAVSAPPRNSQTAAIAIIAGAAIVAVGVGAWFVMQRGAGTSASTVSSVTTTAAAPVKAIAPSTNIPGAVVAAETAKPDAAALSISAVGLIDPSDPRYQSDKSLLQSDLRADSKGQLIEKALTLLLDRNSFAKNYDVLKDRLLSKSGNYITAVVQEGAPQTGKDGLMSMTTQAVVNVKAVQKALNQMSRDERIDFIRANGDPKISVRILARDADQADSPAMPSPVAENLLKERIKSFGFRTWSEEGARPTADSNGADFAVLGEVAIKKLSMRLQASGLTVSKFALASYTVKVVDRATGEEIYHNTTMPTGLGSWASEGEALQAIGTKIADELSRDLFLQHVNVIGQKVTVSVQGVPDSVSDELLRRELVGLPAVISALPSSGTARTYDLQLGGTGASGDLVAAGVLAPLNAKLGQACFSLGAIASDRVSVVFDKSCADPSVLGRLETNPPAGLYGAPLSRQKTVIKNPEMLRKLTV
ncbi:MAG: serine/threonine protein kinase [Betaproteobacteria bacterium]|nr:MAG: serine/threonine protein kinase [Betaproteobacteria bacterium]